MFIEKRRTKTQTKYYLAHSYRDRLGKVRKIRRYLGADLSQEEIKEKREAAKKEIEQEIREVETEVFGFTLTPAQKNKLNNYSDEIRVTHLNEKQWRRFTKDFVYNTNAIEGSQLAHDEVEQALTHEAHTQDEKEAQGVAQAIDYIRTTNDELDKKLLLKLHEQCFEKTKPFAGKLRDVEVVIRDAQGNIVHQGVPAAQLQAAITDLTGWYHEHQDEFKPLALAAIMHNQFEYIHPFQDGNGRVGRLLLNYVLLRNDYPPINILVEDRQEYYETLQAYSQDQDLLPTMKFLIAQYRKTLKQVTTNDRADD